MLIISWTLILPKELRDRDPDLDFYLEDFMKLSHMEIFIYVVQKLHVSDENCPKNLGVMENSLELMRDQFSHVLTLYIFILSNGQNGLCQYNIQDGHWRDVPRGQKEEKDILHGAIGKRTSQRNNIQSKHLKKY